MIIINFFIHNNILTLISILDIWEKNIYNRIIYIVNIISKTRFILLANIMIYQFFNIYIL